MGKPPGASNAEARRRALSARALLPLPTRRQSWKPFVPPSYVGIQSLWMPRSSHPDDGQHMISGSSLIPALPSTAATSAVDDISTTDHSTITNRDQAKTLTSCMPRPGPPQVWQSSSNKSSTRTTSLTMTLTSPARRSRPSVLPQLCAPKLESDWSRAYAKKVLTLRRCREAAACRKFIEVLPAALAFGTCRAYLYALDGSEYSVHRPVPSSPFIDAPQSEKTGKSSHPSDGDSLFSKPSPRLQTLQK